MLTNFCLTSSSQISMFDLWQGFLEERFLGHAVSEVLIEILRFVVTSLVFVDTSEGVMAPSSSVSLSRHSDSDDSLSEL